MYKNTVKRLLRYLLILIIVVSPIIILFYFFSVAFASKIEIVELKNKQLEETIYIQKESRGLSYEVITISDKKGSKGLNDSRIMNDSGAPFFYKLTGDTLFIYGGWWDDIDNDHLKTRIKHEELENIEFIKLSENYKDKGLKIFPPSYEKVISNRPPAY